MSPQLSHCCGLVASVCHFCWSVGLVRQHDEFPMEAPEGEEEYYPRSTPVGDGQYYYRSEDPRDRTIYVQQQ